MVREDPNPKKDGDVYKPTTHHSERGDREVDKDPKENENMEKKIDVTKIEGYEKMSAEEKLAALENYEFSVDATKYIEKTTFDSKASEASNYSKKIKELEDQLKSRMTPEEAKALAEKEAEGKLAEREKELLDRLTVLEEEKAKAELAKSYMADLGLNNKEAEEAATHAHANDLAKVNAVIKKSLERQQKEVVEQKANKMAGSNLPNGNASGDNKKTEPKELTPAEIAERKERLRKKY